MTESLLSRWRHQVRTAPTAPALTDGDGREWTRAGLDAAARDFAAALPAGVRHQRVTFARPNGGDWFAVFLGLLDAGAVPVPLDASEPPAAQAALARAAGAAWAWMDGRLEPTDVKRRSHRPPHALVKLTSGSTGQPKALAFTSAQMLADGRHIAATMGIRPDDVNFAVIPFGHSYGLGNLVVPLLDQGTAIVCASLPLPQVMAADIARRRPTVFPAVPAVLRALAAAEIAPDSLRPLRTVISAGSPLPPEVAQAFHNRFGIRAHNFYGSSETGGITYDRDGEATLTGRSVGAPLDGVTITPLPGGRFRVASAAVRGRGTFRPADLGSIDERGELVLQGRTGRLCKIAGRRLDLGEFEQELRRVDGVRDAFADRHPHHPDELAVALASARPAAEVRAALRQRLAAWKVPRRLIVLGEFPVNARGKTDRRALQALLATKS